MSLVIVVEGEAWMLSGDFRGFGGEMMDRNPGGRYQTECQPSWTAILCESSDERAKGYY